MTSRKFVGRTAAVASFAGLAMVLAPAAAFAQSGEMNVGSVFNVLDSDALSGSLAGSIAGENNNADSFGSLGAVLNQGSLQIGLENAQGSTSGSAGSIGEAAGTINEDPTTGFAPTVAGSIESASAGPGSAEGLDQSRVQGSIANFLGAIQDYNNEQATP